MGAAGVVGGLQFAQSIQQARALREQAKFEASALELNARLAAVQARDAISRGGRRAQRELERAAQIRGAQRAGFAGQGVVVGEGTAAILEEQTLRIGREAADIVRRNAQREAFGFRVEEQDILGRIQQTRAAARNLIQQTIATGGLEFTRGLIRSGAFDSSAETPELGS